MKYTPSVWPSRIIVGALLLLMGAAFDRYVIHDSASATNSGGGLKFVNETREARNARWQKQYAKLDQERAARAKLSAEKSKNKQDNLMNTYDSLFGEIPKSLASSALDTMIIRPMVDEPIGAKPLQLCAAQGNESNYYQFLSVVSGNARRIWIVYDKKIIHADISDYSAGNFFPNRYNTDTNHYSTMSMAIASPVVNGNSISFDVVTRIKSDGSIYEFSHKYSNTLICSP